MIQKIAYFLHLIDDDNRLNLEDIAFCVILGKIAFSSQVDWTALVTLAVCCLNTIHKRSVDNAPVISEAIQNQTDAIKNVVDKVKGQL